MLAAAIGRRECVETTMARAALSFCTLLLVMPSAGWAQEKCLQERAIYRDAQAGYELRFVPVSSPAAAISHDFKILIPGSETALDGIVMPADEVDRAIGMIMHKCPEGDATGAELEACTVWQGALYGLDAAGMIVNLPEATTEAARQLLVPDFARALRYSSAWEAGRQSPLPWDVFELDGCSG